MNKEIKYIWKLNGHAKRMFNKQTAVNNKHFLDTEKTGYYSSGIIVGTRRDVDYDCDILVKAELKQGNGKFVIEAGVHDKAFNATSIDYATPGYPEVPSIPRILGMYLHPTEAEYSISSWMGKSLNVLTKIKPNDLESKMRSARLTEVSLQHYLNVLSATPQIATDIFEFILGLK